MRMPALILTVVAATLLTAPAGAQDKVNPSHEEQVQESAKKAQELQKERTATLKELVAITTNLFRNGRVEHNEVIDATERLFKAELAAADKESDRIQLYRKMVDVWKQSEEVAEQRWKAARKTKVAVLRFKAMRLEAEIHLERAKVKMGQAKVEKPDVEHPKIGVTTPKAKDVVITQQYVCRIHGQRHIKVRALQKGYLEEIPVKEGQAVKKGDLMFKIVPILYKTKYDAEKAEAELAELELKNAESLAKQNAVSPNEIALYKAKLARVQAKARLAKAELDFAEVRAPFDGIIDRLREQQGSLVMERDILTTLSDNGLMWVYFNVPQARYLEYMTGPANDEEGNIELVLANGKFKRSGKISAIEAQFNDGHGSIPFRADVLNPDRLLRHGMTGTVLMHQTLKNAIVIPQRTTLEVAGKRYVWVVGKDDVAHKREVVVQNELDDIFVINRGVGVDDRIIYEGIRQVRDGEKVRYEFRPPDQILGHQKEHAK
jgi:membrane fusion protein (multidrug efflux system)